MEKYLSEENAHQGIYELNALLSCVDFGSAEDPNLGISGHLNSDPVFFLTGPKSRSSL